MRLEFANGPDDWSLVRCFQRLTHKKGRLHACRPPAHPGADRGHHPEQPYCHGAADPADAHEPGDVPNSALAAEYYAQRADAGLLIAEATQISPVAGYAGAPGITTKRKCRPGSRLPPPCTPRAGAWPCSCGMWAGCRTPACSRSTPPRWPHRRLPPTPTPRCATGWPIGLAPCSLPRALETAEIADLIEDYRQATDRSRRAGFDLVEVHAAHGYLCTSFSRRWPINAPTNTAAAVENARG